MKVIRLITVLAPFLGATTVNANALLADLDDEVTIGKTYTIEWKEDSHEHLELLLVKEVPYAAWVGVETLFENKTGNPPGGSFEWTVSEDIDPGDGYALWLGSENYADITDWFKIHKAPHEAL